MSAVHRSDSVRRASFGLIASGYLALAVSAAMNPLEVPLAALLVAVAYRLRVIGSASDARRRVLARVCIGAGVAGAALVLLDFSMLALIAEASIWGGLALLFADETERGYYASFLVALVQLVIAGGTTDSVVFAAAIVTFVMSGTLALAVMTLRGDAGGLAGRFLEGPPLTRVPVVQNGAWEAEAALLRRLAFSVTGVILSATVVLFFVIPRYGAGYFFSKDQVTERRAAFSDSVDFGAVGAVQQSGSVALRVELVNRSSPYPGILHWRGVGLGHFDGHRWTATEGRRHVLWDVTRGFRETSLLIDGPFLHGGQRLEQKVFLSQDSPILFGATRVHRMWGKFTRLVKSAEGTLEVRFPAYSSRSYTATSDVGRPPPADLRATPATYPPELAARYLQLPDGLDPRVRQLALTIAGDAKTPYDRVTRLEAWLRRELKYELPGPGAAPEHPVEEFLFTRKAGHCEYFAAALAVMARTLGAPSRVVNGYAGGTWSSVGGYYLVADADAHSWVEVFFPSIGWIDFDGTPQDALVHGDGSFSRLRLYWDAMLMAWRRYVIDYHLLDQIESVRSLASLFRGDRADAPGEAPRSRGLPPLVVVVLLVGAVLIGLWRRLVRQASSARAPERLGDASFYLRLLEVLARKGFPRRDSQTPRELAAAVARAWPAAGPAVAALTGAYERIRFGGRPLADPPAIQAALDELERAAPPHPSA